ncbi:MATH domain and coiled-coil domain-containing protein At3g58410 isoform X1 [Brassica rapa]|uniref:MATH domain and coiled-coil domain-containing protein At3g58410 isoform X1 n=1 Tax=Brassica campestris TaxID=3711 RepID=UPI00142E2901|nr:MATH domain and coiled-coil domain-containing protein At3g58410 isoform X1 [Brassica rapa]
MANQVSKKFTWVIDDFSMQSEMYSSVPVLIGDCEWYIFIDPKEENVNSLYMGLEVADPESLPSGWRRYVKLRLSVGNQYLGELALLNENHLWFDQKKLGYGFSTNVPLTKLLDESKGFLENGELKIVAEVEVAEVVGTYGCSEEYECAYQSPCEMMPDDGPKPLRNKTQESVDVNGFHVLPSQVEKNLCSSSNFFLVFTFFQISKECSLICLQVKFVRCIFERHPGIAVGFRSKNQLLRKTSMNFLLNLIETLCQSLQDLSNEDLEDADISLTYLKDVGFEVEWLGCILDDVKEKKEKEQSSLVRLREMDDSSLKLKQKCSDLDALVKEEEAELSATRTPLSFYEVV